METNIDNLNRKNEQETMQVNGLYAANMSDLARKQNKNLQVYLGNSYNQDMANREAKAAKDREMEKIMA